MPQWWWVGKDWPKCNCNQIYILTGFLLNLTGFTFFSYRQSSQLLYYIYFYKCTFFGNLFTDIISSSCFTGYNLAASLFPPTWVGPCGSAQFKDVAGSLLLSDLVVPQLCLKIFLLTAHGRISVVISPSSPRSIGSQERDIFFILFVLFDVNLVWVWMINNKAYLPFPRNYNDYKNIWCNNE